MHKELVSEIQNKPIGFVKKDMPNGKVSKFKHLTTHLKRFPKKRLAIFVSRQTLRVIINLKNWRITLIYIRYSLIKGNIPKLTYYLLNKVVISVCLFVSLPAHESGNPGPICLKF